MREFWISVRYILEKKAFERISRPNFSGTDTHKSLITRGLRERKTAKFQSFSMQSDFLIELRLTGISHDSYSHRE